MILLQINNNNSKIEDKENIKMLMPNGDQLLHCMLVMKREKAS